MDVRRGAEEGPQHAGIDAQAAAFGQPGGPSGEDGPQQERPAQDVGQVVRV